MTSAVHYFWEKLIEYNNSQDDGMVKIKLPSWQFLEIKHQAEDLETQLNKNSFGKGQEWEHKNFTSSQAQLFTEEQVREAIRKAPLVNIDSIIQTLKTT